MHLAVGSAKSTFRTPSHAPNSADRTRSEYAIAEINAYIAIRDNLLAEAEASTNAATIRRVSLANDFVQTCLQPARSPYEAQYLPEANAARERKRSEMVKNRIAELRAQLAGAALPR